MKNEMCQVKNETTQKALKEIDMIQSQIESIQAMLESLINRFKQGMIRFIIESIHYAGDMIQKKSESIKMV